MKLFVPIALAATVALGAATVDAPAEPTRSRADCARTTTGLVPLTDMGGRRYRGQRGGLYPFGRNRPSPAYQRLGLAAARRVRPVDGKIVVLSIGMSNTTREFSDFKSRADRDPVKSGLVELVDGARGRLGCAEDQVAGFSLLAARRPAAQRVQLVSGSGSGGLAQAGDHGRRPPVPARRASSPREPDGRSCASCERVS